MTQKPVVSAAPENTLRFPSKASTGGGRHLYPVFPCTITSRASRPRIRPVDHLLLSPSAAGRLASAGVDREVRGFEKASDHAPVWIELDGDRTKGAARRRAGRTKAGLG